MKFWSQNLGLWSTWVNLIFSILTNCNFLFFRWFFSLSIKGQEISKGDFRFSPYYKNNEILYIFLPPPLNVVKSKHFSFFLNSPNSVHNEPLFFDFTTFKRLGQKSIQNFVGFFGVWSGENPKFVLRFTDL